MLFKRGDLSVELFAPQKADMQQPHEVERVPFGPGDFLFVAAGVPHAFESFTDDFKTWVIFFGPKGGHEM